MITLEELVYKSADSNNRFNSYVEKIDPYLKSDAIRNADEISESVFQYLDHVYGINEDDIEGFIMSHKDRLDKYSSHKILFVIYPITTLFIMSRILPEYELERYLNSFFCFASCCDKVISLLYQDILLDNGHLDIEDLREIQQIERNYKNLNIWYLS